jgi:signal transduction histidine kinase
MKKHFSQSVIVLLLLGAALIVAVNAWLAFRAEEALANSEWWVSHTWQVMNHVEVLVSSLKGAEAGIRGYVLTGNSDFVTPYTEALQQVPGELDELTRLTEDNPRQQQRLLRMRSVTGARLEVLGRIVATEQRGDARGALALVKGGTGAAEMNIMRAIATAMTAEEQQLLVFRLHASAAARLQARNTVLVASSLDVLFIVLTFFSLRYERKLRQLATGNSERLRKLQVISDVGLTQLSLAELASEMLARLRTVADADAVVLCDATDTQPISIEITAADGAGITEEGPIEVEPGSPLYQAVSQSRIVKLTGRQLESIPIASLRLEMGTLLIVPLAASGDVTALLIAGRRRINAFSDEDEHLFSVVADRIARAIERARIYEAEREARRLAEVSMAEVADLNAELENRVRVRTLELEATNRELEAFSYSVSHDLRAPLRSVDGFSVALAEDYGDVIPADGQHYLARIRAGVQRMGQLIDALLQLSRITRAELTSEPVDLSALAREAASELRHLNPDRKLDFRIEEGLTTRGDPKLLRVIFDNMFGNAVKFTAKRADAVIEFGQAGGTYFIRDNGAGFDQQYAGKLFNAFQRLHGEKDFAGSGIGLATVSRVVRRHQGTLRAEGVVGAGATFWFTLG